jgi:hypothetical protein
MNSEEKSVVEFSISYADNVNSSSYYAGYERYLRGIDGEPEVYTLQGTLDHTDPESTKDYLNSSQNGEKVIYSSYYHLVYGIKRPVTNNVYTTGDVKIYT